MSHRILIVDDEPEIGAYLRRGLAYESYHVELVTDGDSALIAAEQRPPDLVLLDVMLPGMDGFEVARRLRQQSAVPIIMLTARDAVSDRVAGLECGADDYLVKPFAFEELLARVKVQLRRRSAGGGEQIRIGNLVMDITAHTVVINQRRVDLTAKEFEVLELFARHPNQVLTREIIYQRVWGYDYGHDSNVIEVYVRSLRQKLEAAADRMLHTVRGVGYVLRSH